MTATLFVTLTLADAQHWPALAVRSAELGCAAAVLQGDGPALVTQWDALAAAGHRSILVVPVTLGEAGVPASWVGRVVRWWLGRRPEPPAEVLLATTVLRALPEAIPPVGEARIQRANDETLTNPTWADPPPVHTHVLVCRGPRCTAKGAEAAGAVLESELHRRGLLDRDVLVTQTGCLFPCNRAPVVALQPRMSWRTLSPEGVGELVDEIEGSADLSRAPRCW